MPYRFNSFRNNLRGVGNQLMDFTIISVNNNMNEMLKKAKLRDNQINYNKKTIENVIEI